MPVFVPAFFQPEAYNCEEVMVKTRIRNRLAETRKRRGVGAAGLAGRVGVSRQTIYAIEAGTYVPNTEVALHLARELERPGAGQKAARAHLPGRVALGRHSGQRLSLLPAGSRWHRPASRTGEGAGGAGCLRAGRRYLSETARGCWVRPGPP